KCKLGSGCRYECHCTARYTGNNCEVDAGDPCLQQPCRRGTCVETAGGDYRCLCPPAYHGVHCEAEASQEPACAGVACRNNGSCAVSAALQRAVCTCPPGFTGALCEVDVDECAAPAAADACLNGGRCRDAPGHLLCDCTGTGYTGARCEVNVNECLQQRGVCGHGLCYDTYGGFVCACLAGYTGERCDTVSALQQLRTLRALRPLRALRARSLFAK
ncbi:hypothetical protein ACJJTC_005184, partial [Scirpophaga incertulas]